MALATRRLKYFAYGSNLYGPRMRTRAPSARVHAVGRLDRYVLKFHKRGSDGSGKCNVLYTGLRRNTLYGVVFDINARERRLLDEAEGFGQGYDDAQVEVITATGVVEAFTYVAQGDAINDRLKPFMWYKMYVIEGAKRKQLPEAYIRHLHAVEAVHDDNEERARYHHELLAISRR